MACTPLSVCIYCLWYIEAAEQYQHRNTYFDSKLRIIDNEHSHIHTKWNDAEKEPNKKKSFYSVFVY